VMDAITLYLVALSDLQSSRYEPLAAGATPADAEAIIVEEADDDERDAYRVDELDLCVPAPLDGGGEWVLTRQGWRWLEPLDHGLQRIGTDLMQADPPEWKTGVGPHLVPRFKQVRPAYRLVEPEGRS
jgi:hypothetical protein